MQVLPATIALENPKVGDCVTLDFCKDWIFRKEGGKPIPVDLPHDAMIAEKRDGGCRNGVNSGYFPGGKYVYEKTFDLDKAMMLLTMVLRIRH